MFQFWSVLDWQTHTSWFRGTCCAVRQAFGHGGGQQSAPRHTTASSARNPAAAHGEAESARHRQVISGAAADAVTDAGIHPQHREAALQRLHGLHRRRFAPYVVLPLPRLAGHLLDHDVRPPAVLLLVPGPVQRRPGSARARMRCSYPASREASLLTCLQQRLVPWRHAWPRRGHAEEVLYPQMMHATVAWHQPIRTTWLALLAFQGRWLDSSWSPCC